LTTTNISGADFRDILAYCEKTGARIKVAPDLMSAVTGESTNNLLRDVQPQDLLGRAPIGRHEGIDLSIITSKVTLVTGAAGSIGSELCRQLCNFRAARIILLDNNESNLHELHIELLAKYPQVQFVPVLADITIREMLCEVFERYQPQVVFHAAAYKHVPMLESYPAEALRVNINGTRNLLAMAQTFAVERFVLISTDKAVNPSSVMGASKRICELMLHALALENNGPTLFTSVRFGNVLGSRGSVLPIFEHQIEAGGPITITHPDMTRYFMTIPEATNLVIHAACLTAGDDLFLLKMGEMVKIVDLAERMVRLRGLRLGKDIHVHYTGVRPGEKLYEELYTGSEQLIDTAHPSIVKLQAKQPFSMDVRRFWASLDAVMQGRVECNFSSLLEVVQLGAPSKENAGSADTLVAAAETASNDAFEAQEPQEVVYAQSA
jgi:FlaA1/EpsC-like NDP-sugar epimerase